MATMVNTVIGPVSSDDLGKTLVHEHFMFGYPGYQVDVRFGKYAREGAVQIGIEVAGKAKAYGVKTIVDATPNECGWTSRFCVRSLSVPGTRSCAPPATTTRERAHPPTSSSARL